MHHQKTEEAQLEITRIMRSVCNSYTVMANQILQPLGLTVTQSEILLYLYQQPSEPVETRTLLQLLQISPTSLSSTLKHLKQKGYIRFSQRGDMRKKQVSLTVRALEIQGELTAAMLHLEEIYLRTVTDSEYTTVQEALQKIMRNIKTQLEAKQI